MGKGIERPTARNLTPYFIFFGFFSAFTIGFTFFCQQSTQACSFSAARPLGGDSRIAPNFFSSAPQRSQVGAIAMR